MRQGALRKGLLKQLRYFLKQSNIVFLQPEIGGELFAFGSGYFKLDYSAFPDRLLTDSRQIFREFGMIGFYPIPG